MAVKGVVVLAVLVVVANGSPKPLFEIDGYSGFSYESKRNSNYAADDVNDAVNDVAAVALAPALFAANTLAATHNDVAQNTAHYSGGHYHVSGTNSARVAARSITAPAVVTANTVFDAHNAAANTAVHSAGGYYRESDSGAAVIAAPAVVTANTIGATHNTAVKTTLGSNSGGTYHVDVFADHSKASPAIINAKVDGTATRTFGSPVVVTAKTVAGAHSSSIHHSGSAYHVGGTDSTMIAAQTLAAPAVVAPNTVATAHNAADAHSAIGAYHSNGGKAALITGRSFTAPTITISATRNANNGGAYTAGASYQLEGTGTVLTGHKAGNADGGSYKDINGANGSNVSGARTVAIGARAAGTPLLFAASAAAPAAVTAYNAAAPVALTAAAPAVLAAHTVTSPLNFAGYRSL